MRVEGKVERTAVKIDSAEMGASQYKTRKAISYRKKEQGVLGRLKSG